MGFIYKITHIPSEKSYIGQTTCLPFDRWAQHLAEHRFIERNKIHEFCFQILCECDNSQLNDLEKMYIEQYGSYLSGFNRNPGGNCFRRKEEGFLTRYISKEKTPTEN